MSSQVNAEIGKNIRKAVGQLTPRQRDVFTRIQTGASIKEISDDLQLSLNTVKTHFRAAKRKLRQLLLPIYVVEIPTGVFQDQSNVVEIPTGVFQDQSNVASLHKILGPEALPDDNNDVDEL